jgi:lipopolysaccharide transport system permease protein
MLITRALFDWPGNLQVGGELLRVVRANRDLISELVRRDLKDRFAGQMLGTLWAIGHPLLLMLLYVAVFTFVFPARGLGIDGKPQDLSVYILAGLIPWLCFQEVLVRSAGVITGNASLVKQIVFPIEVLPVKIVLAATPAQLVASGFLVVFAAVTGSLKASVLLFPLAFAAQLACMVGVAFLLASLGAYVRDVREILTVFCAANLFLQPILYAPEQLPPALANLLWLNPFSHVIWVYQDVFFFGGFTHPWSWVVLGVGAALSLLWGYRLFRRMKHGFGDVL